MALLGHAIWASAALAAVMGAGIAAAQTGPAARPGCAAGSDACPVQVRMRPGTDSITLSGRLTKARPSVSYAMAARAGQTLYWSFKGPNIRTVIKYPDGATDGPGLEPAIRLPTSGTYVFTVSSNLMAEDIFGPFRLTIRIK